MTQPAATTNGDTSVAELRQQLHDANNRAHTAVIKADLLSDENVRLRSALAAIRDSAQAALVTKEP